MKRNLSTSLRTVVAFSIILVSPGLAAAQSVGIAAESSAGAASVSASAAPAALAGATRIGAISAPLTPALALPLSGLTARSAPAAEPAAANPAAATAAAAPVAAAAAGVPGAPEAAPVAAEAQGVPAPAAVVAPEAVSPVAADEHAAAAAMPELRADPSDRVAVPGGSSALSSASNARGGMRGLFDGWRNRGAAVDANAPAVPEAGAPASAASRLRPASARSAFSSAAKVPSPRFMKAVQILGFAYSAYYATTHWIAPHFAAIAAGAAPIAQFVGRIHPAAAAGAAVIGAISAFSKSRRAGQGALRTAGSTLFGAASGAAKMNVALTAITLATNGLSMVGLNPLITLASAATLAVAAYSALSDPTLSRGARIRRALPAAVGALLLAGQSVLIFSVASVPQLAAASILAAGAAAAIAQAALGRADSRAAARTSVGLIVQAVGLGLAMLVYAPALIWAFVALGGVGLLLSLSGLLRALRAPRAAAPSAPAAPISPAAAAVAPAADDAAEAASATPDAQAVAPAPAVVEPAAPAAPESAVAAPADAAVVPAPEDVTAAKDDAAPKKKPARKGGAKGGTSKRAAGKRAATKN